MAMTRMKKFKYTRFHEGQLQEFEVIIPENVEKILSAFDREYARYLGQVNVPPVFDPEHPFLSLQSVIFPVGLQPISDAVTQKLFQSINEWVQQAIQLHQGGLLGYGADPQAYQVLASSLRNIGSYMTTRIQALPWYVPVAKEYYLMTLLTESPQAFLHAQQDQDAATYVKAINLAKMSFPKEKLAKNLGNLSAQFQGYAQKLETINLQYAAKTSRFKQQIKQIEAERAQRWGITNFFKDLFWDEIGELENTKAKLKTATLIHTKLEADLKFDLLTAVKQSTQDKIRHELQANMELDAHLTKIAQWKEINEQIDGGLDSELMQKIEDKKNTIQAELLSSLSLDLVEIEKGSIVTERTIALNSRFKHIFLLSPYNEFYSLIMKTMLKHLESDLTPQQVKEYLQDLQTILPIEIQNEPSFKELIQKQKFALVKKYFSSEQQKLHAEYQAQLEFLRTGDLDGWTLLFAAENPLALTEENFTKWRREFVHQYTRSLMTNQELAMKFAGLDQQDADIVLKYLAEEISKEIKELSHSSTQHLTQLISLRRVKQVKEGRDWSERFSHSFSSQSQSNSINLFMLRYTALTAHQYHCASDSQDLGKILASAGEDFIQTFQEEAQSSSGFVLGLVANLPLEALNEMYMSWGMDPKIQFSSATKTDFIGKVEPGNHKSIQLPKYLFVRMVMELTIADFNAVLKGDKVNIALMQDRLVFLIPKLQEQLKVEENLNENPGELSQQLLSAFASLNTGTINERYSELISKKMLDFKLTPVWDKWKVLTNKAEYDQVLFKHLKIQLLKLLDIFAGIKSEDIKCDFTEEDFLAVDKEMNKLTEEMLMERDEVRRNNLNSVIETLKLKKEKISTEIKCAAAKVAYLNGFHEYFCGEDGDKLRKKTLTATSLNELIEQLNPAMFVLFEDEKLADACVALQQYLSLSKLIKSEGLSSYEELVRKSAEKKSIKIIDVIRDFPEEIKSAFPAPIASMIGELQYRFADYFTPTMTKILDEKNIASLASAVPETIPVKPENTSWWGMPTMFFSRAEEKSKVEVVSTAESRLQAILQSLNTDLMKEMFALLSPKDELKHLYQKIGVSAPLIMSHR